MIAKIHTLLENIKTKIENALAMRQNAGENRGK